MGERIVLGATHIDVADHDFSAGYQEGYHRYTTYYHDKPLTDASVYDFLARTVNDCFHTDRHRAGYIIGWCAALHMVGRPGATIGYYIAGQDVQVTG